MAFVKVLPLAKVATGILKISTVAMRKGGTYRLQVSMPHPLFTQYFGSADRFDVQLGTGVDEGKMLLEPSEGGGLQTDVHEGDGDFPALGHRLHSAVPDVERKAGNPPDAGRRDGDASSRLGVGQGTAEGDRAGAQARRRRTTPGARPMIRRSHLLVAGSLAVALIASPVFPHSFYDVACCSGRDCQPVSAGAVKSTPGGWLVVVTGETIPYQSFKVKHSPDGQFHRCALSADFSAGGRTLCLYVPDPGA